MKFNKNGEPARRPNNFIPAKTVHWTGHEGGFHLYLTIGQLDVAFARLNEEQANSLRGGLMEWLSMCWKKKNLAQ